MTMDVMPSVVAHRGASAYAPENTLAALREAASRGARWVEFDVRLAACGTPMVLHDARLERTTNGRGRLLDHPAAALPGLDAGSWFGPRFAGEAIPTLDAALETAAGLGLGANVEIKAETDAVARSTARAVVARLRRWSHPFVISSFNIAALEAARRASGDVPIGLLCGRGAGESDVERARGLDAVSFHGDRAAFTPALVEALLAPGLWPAAYTVNDRETAGRLWSMGVRTIISDRPDDLLAVAPGE